MNHQILPVLDRSSQKTLTDTAALQAVTAATRPVADLQEAAEKTRTRFRGFAIGVNIVALIASVWINANALDLPLPAIILGLVVMHGLFALATHFLAVSLRLRHYAAAAGWAIPSLLIAGGFGYLAVLRYGETDSVSLPLFGLIVDLIPAVMAFAAAGAEIAPSRLEWIGDLAKRVRNIVVAAPPEDQIDRYDDAIAMLREVVGAELAAPKPDPDKLEAVRTLIDALRAHHPTRAYRDV